MVRGEAPQGQTELKRGRCINDDPELEELLKNCKVCTRHLNQNKKFREFGPPANSMESAFTDERGNRITVAQYFHGMMAKSPDSYQALQFPFLPTVNVGSKQRAVLVPMELVDIVPGQTRTRSVTGDISAQIIKYAAMLPNDRFKNISQNSSLFSALADDQDAEHFGLAQIAATVSGDGKSGPLPMRVTGTILPPPRLQYGNKPIEPQLKGAWNMGDRTTFAHPAPIHQPGGRVVHRTGDRGSPPPARVMRTTSTARCSCTTDARPTAPSKCRTFSSSWRTLLARWAFPCDRSWRGVRARSAC